MNNKTIIWMGGWSSPFSVWEDLIINHLPHAYHKFIDSNRIQQLVDFPKEEKSVLVVGWSLGSLVLHQILAAKKLPLNWQYASICPIFHFCSSSSHWTPVHLNRMQRNLQRDKKKVLLQFWNDLTGSSFNDIFKSQWMAKALKIPHQQLIEDLEILKSIKVDPGEIMDYQVHFLTSANDPLTAVQPKCAGRPVETFPNGHLPFLEYPEITFRFLIPLAES